jgi:LGFP repeat
MSLFEDPQLRACEEYMPDQEPSGEGPASVSLYDSQGTQVGTGNVQYNHYGHRPPRDLTALSVHAAVAYIRQLTHDEAVDLFAHTRPDDLADKLTVLLRTDESKVLQILADLNPSQAAKLISLLTGDFPWVADLPEAAQAIAQLAIELRWDRTPGVNGIERAPQSPDGTDGFFQQFQQGHVYWSDQGDEAYAVSGAIAKVYLAAGGTGQHQGL